MDPIITEQAWQHLLRKRRNAQQRGDLTALSIINGRIEAVLHELVARIADDPEDARAWEAITHVALRDAA